MSTDQFIWLVEHVIEYTCVSFASRENFTSALKNIPRTFADLESGMAWPYLIVSLLIAYGLFVLSRRRRTDTVQSFCKFLFPSHVYQHPSAVLDYKFYAVSLVLDALVIGPIILGIAVVGYKMTMAFSAWLSWLPPATMPQSYLIGAAFGLFLLSDLMFYVSHYLFHKIPMLWAFHVVHHSAEVLTPITARRFHPMETLVGAVMQAPVAGATSFLYQALSAHDRQITLIFGVSIFVFVFALSGRHLRHSHIWLSYGPVVSWLLISPAQHQIIIVLILGTAIITLARDLPCGMPCSGRCMFLKNARFCRSACLMPTIGSLQQSVNCILPRSEMPLGNVSGRSINICRWAYL